LTNIVNGCRLGFSLTDPLVAIGIVGLIVAVLHLIVYACFKCRASLRGKSSTSSQAEDRRRRNNQRPDASKDVETT